MVNEGWIVACVGDANTRGWELVWVGIVGINKVIVLIGVVLLSEVGIRVLDCFRMLE